MPNDRDKPLDLERFDNDFTDYWKEVTGKDNGQGQPEPK